MHALDNAVIVLASNVKYELLKIILIFRREGSIVPVERRSLKWWLIALYL